MYIQKLRLSKFRNFKTKVIEFSQNVTVIVGPNASGKSNILESIYLLSTGRSYRARIEEEMIRYSDEISRVKGKVIFDGDSKILESVLTRGKIEVGEDKFERTPRKKLFINGVSKRLIDFASNFRVVLFGPWDLDLVTESPSLRRKFLDAVLSQVDREYRRASLSYEKGLRQRNKLLFRIREEGLGRSQLLFWDRLLIKNGDYIARRREDLINFVNGANFQFPMVRQAHHPEQSRGISNFQLEYDRSAISEARLEQYATEEVASATTLVGPHRDDFVFNVKRQKSKVKSRELARYGSRGEQRMGVLWLKLAELAFVEDKTGEKSTLLLDDIFSELDHEHRKIVMDASSGQQTIITTADGHFIEHFNPASIIRL